MGVCAVLADVRVAICFSYLFPCPSASFFSLRFRSLLSISCLKSHRDTYLLSSDVTYLAHRTTILYHHTRTSLSPALSIKAPRIIQPPHHHTNPSKQHPTTVVKPTPQFTEITENPTPKALFSDQTYFPGRPISPTPQRPPQPHPLPTTTKRQTK
jgi:hypothetical protein